MTARIPLTDLQQAYLLGRDSFALGGQAQGYIEIELTAPDWDRLEVALNQVIARQPMLRSAVTDDTHLEVADAIPAYRIARADDTGAESARRLAAEPFDRTVPPLIRVVARDTGPGAGRIHFAYDFTIMDSSSVDIFFAEWARYYRQPESPTAALVFPRTDDYAGSTDRTRRAWDYWEERLDDLPGAPRLGLPALADRSRTVMRSHQLSQKASVALRDHATAHRATVSALLITAYADALQLWTEDPRFLLTLTVFDRPAGADGVIGNFSTTVLLDITSCDPAFAARLDDVQDKLWDGLQHRAVSGVALGRELQRRRRTVEPIAPVVFTSLLGTPAGNEPLGPVVGYDSHTPQALFDLVVSERDGALRLTLYGQDGFGLRSVAEGLWYDLLSWLEHLAGQVRAGADIGLPPPSTSSVRRAPSPPPERRFASLTEIAASLPGGDDDPALADAGFALRRAELRQMVTAIAEDLLSRGAGPGTLVAIAVPRGLDQYLLALAVSRAGAAYVPIDVTLPSPRQQQILARANPDLLVVYVGAADLVAPAGCVRIDHRGLSLTAPAGLGRPGRGTPGDLAYVLYTSGSTGEPKGVAMSGQAVANTLNDVVVRFGIGPRDVVVSTAQLGFDLSVFDLFGVLMVGGCVVVADVGLEREPDALLDLMRRSRATIWNSVPGMLEILIQHLEDVGERLPPSLRLVMVSGDVIAPTLPSRARALAGPLDVVALGGATEAGIWSNFHLLAPEDPPPARVPYGRALAGQVLEVVDFARRPRPPDTIGEIVIGGASLADGYWRDTALTRDRFVGEGGDRRYLTSDLGFVRPDGVIEILGRSDRQVKINGHRVELGDVEAAIHQVPGVRGAIVNVTRTEGRASLRACVAGSVTRSDDIVASLRARVPDHLIPRSWLLLAAFPLTRNGKIDHAALAAMEKAAGADVARAPQAPLSATESWLARLWQEVLGVASAGAEENFFELGGDSLLATRLRSRLAKEHGVQVSVRALFASADLREMAERIDRAGPAALQAAVRRTAVDVLRRRSGAGADEIGEAPNLFDAGILTSHSVASAAVELEEIYAIDLLGDFRVSEWTRLDSIVGLLVRQGARP
jgi:amino acid adenylation domain-containing protein